MKTNEPVEDYHARLNIEGGRRVWLGNHPKIEYVFRQSKKYLKPGMSACEIGIGDGHLLRLLSRYGLSVTGIDISGYLVQKLEEMFRDEGLEIRLWQHDISKPLDNLKDSFDGIFAFDVLEHIESLDKAVENIAKLLKPEGFLVATLPWKENLDDNMVICPRCNHKFHRVGHFHSFHSQSDIAEMLGESFRIINFGFIPPEELEGRGIDFLKKTVFRARYYKDGLPDFQTTCFFIAQRSQTQKRPA
jgi:SAM-dependent methyltransferase